MTAELLTIAAGLACAGPVSSSPAEQHVSRPPTHTRTEFHFVVNAPLEQAAPLFGADEERKWAPGWDPQFVYPLPAKDQAGSVFRVEHGRHTSVWTTTAFDLAGGHVQYVYVMNSVMVTLIDIHLTREGDGKTAVSVVYERTALAPEANEHVASMAKQDEEFGGEWEQQINGYLEKAHAH
jgi:hypothetical protein